MPNLPDPFWLIVGIIAVACVALYPIRRWRQRHHDYGEEADVDEGGEAGHRATPD